MYVVGGAAVKDNKTYSRWVNISPQVYTVACLGKLIIIFSEFALSQPVNVFGEPILSAPTVNSVNESQVRGGVFPNFQLELS